MTIKIDKFTKLFTAGNYKECASLGQNQISLVEKTDISMLVRLILGSLVFLGENKKANEFYKKNVKRLSKEDLAIALFYLSIGFTRSGDFTAAKNLLLELNSLFKSHPSNSFIQFGFYQALGFFSYFKSRFRKSLAYAEKSKEAAYKTKEDSLIIFADDLFANGQIISGQIYSGIESLKQCYAQSLKVRNLNLAKSIRVSLISFESQYGLLARPVETLKNHLKKIHTQNTYSRNLIWLALLNEYLNQGRLKDFENSYPLAQKEIVKSSQHRHQILLRFKWAHWEFLRFNYEAALLELAKIEEALSLKNDILLLSQIYGLRYKILKDRNADRASQILDQLKFWQIVTGSNRSLNHLSRISKSLTQSQSQDKIGNLINEYYLYGRSEAVAQLVAKKRWIHFHDSLDHTLIRAHQFKRVLVLGFNKGRALFLTDGNWLFVNEPTGLERKIINHLSTEPLSKEKLVELIWGYQYSPLAHDPMLMTLVQRARKYLKELKMKILVSDGVYQLDKPLLLDELTEKLVTKTLSVAMESKTFEDSRLTYRQFKILETISRSAEPVSIGSLLKSNRVSRMTLFRDLQELHLQKRIMRLGKGRGVSYVLFR